MPRTRMPHTHTAPQYEAQRTPNNGVLLVANIVTRTKETFFIIDCNLESFSILLL
jgi:hypothetical protein